MLSRIRKLFRTPFKPVKRLDVYADLAAQLEDGTKVVIDLKTTKFAVLSALYRPDPADDGIEVAILNLFSAWPDGRPADHMPGAKNPREYFQNLGLGPRR